MTDSIATLSKAQIRAKKYYAKNKDTILARLKEKRIAKSVESKPEPESEPAVVVMEGNPLYTFDFCIYSFQIPAIKETTQEIYIKSMKRLHRLLSFDNYFGLNEDPTLVIEKINKSEFSANTRKLLYQTILKLMDLIGMPNTAAYKTQFELHKMKSVRENETRNATKETLSMDQYITLVKNKFGEDSKLFLLAKLYNELAIRDDYGNLIIVSSIKDFTSDTDKNYILVPLKSNAIIRINSYKTIDNFGVITHTCSKELTDLIRTYINANLLQNGDLLFGKNVGAFISQMNSQIAPDLGAINEIRHRVVSDALKKENLSDESRLALATQMKHSPITQLKYNRLLTHL